MLAWMISRKENSALARQLMSEAIARYAITYGTLTLRQDRGVPMIAQGFLDMLGDLGVTSSHSRPRVSNDNPFSEAQFQTLKYQPDYPGRFESPSHPGEWCAGYCEWYNHHHHHAGLGGYTPEQVFTGRYTDSQIERQTALDVQYRRSPERFVQGAPIAAAPPAPVTINPVDPDTREAGDTPAVNFRTLNAAKGL